MHDSCLLSCFHSTSSRFLLNYLLECLLNVQMVLFRTHPLWLNRHIHLMVSNSGFSSLVFLSISILLPKHVYCFVPSLSLYLWGSVSIFLFSFSFQFSVKSLCHGSGYLLDSLSFGLSVWLVGF